MKDLAAAILTALLVYLCACFVTFEPDMTRWAEPGRLLYLAFSVIAFIFYKSSPWSQK